ncbi:hypothetical protein [Paraburkholderia sprentiae]|uniref:hypothetical protein n=1 Tax=Paraburkholderia sprentiae TaxID=948107 RepID=UPI0012B6515D|nr:hypothetical protein [Paraburkholderia sprentiae]
MPVFPGCQFDAGLEIWRRDRDALRLAVGLRSEPVAARLGPACERRLAAVIVDHFEAGELAVALDAGNQHAARQFLA